MRRTLSAAAFAGALFVGAAPAFAEEAAAHEVPAECPSALSEEADHECLEYWENHINWFSWDYRGGKDQAPEHRHMPPPFGFALINFGVFAYIMYRLAAKPLADFTRARHETIRKDLDEASALHKEAEEKLKAYGDKIAGLDKEIDELIRQVRHEAEAEKARIVAEAEAQAVRLRVEAEAQVQVELRRMRAQLQAETVSAALAAAEKMIAAGVTSDDQRRLAERFVGELDKPAAAPARS